ncbi:MAG TPA: DUF4097 family beta strand repeat-containing protein [Candidatus Eisenbacteria bacterium]|jgi:DUF4097 and DUF4098 domain-containing protein YvlB
MTQRSLWAAAVALGAALTGGAVSPAPAGAAEARAVTEKTFEFAPGGEVAIDNQNGRITIEAWDRPRVRIQVTRVARASDDAKARAYLKEIRADVEIRRGKLEIVSRYPKRKETTGLFAILVERVASFQTHYYLQVPVETALELETANGLVRVRGTRGAVRAETTNGNIEIAGVAGPMDTHSTNGGIEVRSASGSLSAETTNGPILAELKSLDREGGVTLETTNGNVRLYLPSAVRADLAAETTNGRVSISFPVSDTETMTSKSVRGTINGGGTEVSLSTTNGDIDVRRLGERGAR